MRWLWVGCLALGCSGSGASGPCNDLCAELVNTCDYQAFPNLGSCLDGCEFNSAQGADIPGQLACVRAAACDTFAVVECEHTYGL